MREFFKKIIKSSEFIDFVGIVYVHVLLFWLYMVNGIEIIIFITCCYIVYYVSKIIFGDVKK